MLSPNKWRSARRPTIRTASLAQLTTLEGGCLGGGRNPLAVYCGESTQSDYAFRLEGGYVPTVTEPEPLLDHQEGVLLRNRWQRSQLFGSIVGFHPLTLFG